MKNKKTRWIIQDNLIAENDLKQMRTACENHNIEFQEVNVIPFDTTPISHAIDDNHINIYYGSVSFIDSIYNKEKPIGIFYNPIDFSIENYIDKWGIHMLNSDAFIGTLGEFITKDFEDTKQFFVRPDADDKSFAGEVMYFKSIKTLHQNVTNVSEKLQITNDTKIIASTPYNIKKEWRNYIVDGKIVSSTLYRQNFKLKKSSEDIPQEMLEFVEARISEYQPHDIFCIDVCYCGDSYYIIECGCINSCGFYAADISKIVLEVSKFIKLKYCG